MTAAAASRRGVFRRLIDSNVRASRAVADRLELESDKPFWQAFQSEAAERIGRLRDGDTVVDLGGGRRCVYAAAVPPGRDLRLVAVDVSAEELAANDDVDETRVANVAEGLPFDDGSVQLILSRALLEHVDGVPAAARHMGRVVAPGGTALHFVPCRYSLFGTAARLLPFHLMLDLLHRVSPGTRGQVEFETHYDNCHPDGLERAFRDAGFRRVEVDVCFAQPGYFEPVFPLFLLTSLYERAVRALGLRRLSAYALVRAER